MSDISAQIKAVEDRLTKDGKAIVFLSDALAKVADQKGWNVSSADESTMMSVIEGPKGGIRGFDA